MTGVTVMRFMDYVKCHSWVASLLTMSMVLAILIITLIDR